MIKPIFTFASLALSSAIFSSSVFGGGLMKDSFNNGIGINNSNNVSSASYSGQSSSQKVNELLEEASRLYSSDYALRCTAGYGSKANSYKYIDYVDYATYTKLGNSWIKGDLYDVKYDVNLRDNIGSTLYDFLLNARIYKSDSKYIFIKADINPSSYFSDYSTAIIKLEKKTGKLKVAKFYNIVKKENGKNGTGNYVRFEVKSAAKSDDSSKASSAVPASVIKSAAKGKIEDYISAQADFAFDLFKKDSLEAVKKGENVMISPVSVYLAISMLANGADGETLNEITEVLGDKLSLKEINSFNKSYTDALTKGSTEKFKLNIANSAWYKSGIGLSLKKDFENNLKNYYNAQIKSVAFDKSTVKEINSWVSKNTDEMINKIVDEFNGLERLNLINAVCFDSKWKDPYEDEDVKENQNFTNSKGETEKVTMLNSSEEYAFKTDYAEGFVKDYSGDRYRFVAILPNKGLSNAEVMEKLSGDEFIKIMDSLERPDELYVKIPEFTYEYESEMTSTLKKLGIKKAFTDSAELTEIFNQKESLSVSGVLHKTFIKLDKEGTKAAAVTSILVGCTSIQPRLDIRRIYLDRPFIYAIVDTEYNLPVFVGAVNSIK